MTKNSPTIDFYCFEKQFQLFKRFVEKAGNPLRTFGSNVYLISEEGYKDTVHKEGHNALNLRSWKESDLGKGDIANSVIRAVEFKNNNLVTIDRRYGPERRALHKLHESFKDPIKLAGFERGFFGLFHGNNDNGSFTNLVDLFGKSYPIIAYLFFLKDRSLYMPIAPRTFDEAFKKLGVIFSTERKCSWENYSVYMDLLRNVQWLLMEKIPGDISLLDAHSFTYILAKQMSREDEKSVRAVQGKIEEYQRLTQKDRDAVTKARIGQGPFRRDLLAYWGVCAITGCSEQLVLKASHIKPWKDCSAYEATDQYNGILLSPNIDALFDAGFISFTDSGAIIISTDLSPTDAHLLGINEDMMLRQQLDTRHFGYLRYHRENLFRGKLPLNQSL